MSVTKQIVKLLSAKYNFSSEEALEYVTTQLKTLKTMTKEEKAALRNQQKEQAKVDAKAAKEQAKADAKAAKEQAKADAKAAKKSEKKSKKQNNTETDANVTNDDAAAAPVEKEEKPKKPRTEAQIAATTKMIEANKLKKIAAAAAK